MDWSAIFSPFNLTLFILLITIGFFVKGKVRSDLVAVCSLLALLVFGILDTKEALSGFSSSIVLMMVGLFIVGGGIFRTGLAKAIGQKILKLAGGNENLLFVLVMLATALIGGFVSNTGTVAIMMPIIISIAAATKLNIRRYLMPLAFASAMGNFTLISTPPNMVIQESLISNGFDPLSFFSFAPIGCIAVVVGVTILFFSSKLLKPLQKNEEKSKQGKTLSELVEEYALDSSIWKVTIPEGSQIIGKSLEELKLTSRFEIGIGKIDHKVKTGFLLKKEETITETAKSTSVITAGDTLLCHGDRENIEAFRTEYGLQLSEISDDERKTNSNEYGLAEVIILPDSSLENRTVIGSRIREQYHINVVGLKSRGSRFTRDIKELKMQSGDILLVSGKWDNIATLSANRKDFVTVGQPEKEADKVTLDKKAPVAALILIGMVLCMTLEILPSVTSVLIAAVLMVISGCLKNVEEAYSYINWNSVVLIAAMLPMSIAFEKTGITAYLSDGLMQGFGSMGPLVMLIAIYCFTSILSLFISNTATAVLFAPIAMKTSLLLGVSPYPFLIAVAVSASMCFASPFSTPPNALVMNAGNYKFMDYIKIGLPLQVVIGIVMVICIPLLFPF